MTYGQSKDLLIPFSSTSVNECVFTLTYDSVGQKEKSIQFGVKETSQDSESSPDGTFASGESPVKKFRQYNFLWQNIFAKAQRIFANWRSSDGLTFQQAGFEQIIRHKFRLEFVHCIRTTLENLRENPSKSRSHKETLEETMNSITQLKKEMTKYANQNDEFIKDLLVDLTGQVQLALEKEDWFMKWGIHYLPSLTREYDKDGVFLIEFPFVRCSSSAILQ